MKLTQIAQSYQGSYADTSASGVRKLASVVPTVTAICTAIETVVRTDFHAKAAAML